VFVFIVKYIIRIRKRATTHTRHPVCIQLKKVVCDIFAFIRWLSDSILKTKEVYCVHKRLVVLFYFFFAWASGYLLCFLTWKNPFISREKKKETILMIRVRGVFFSLARSLSLFFSLSLLIETACYSHIHTFVHMKSIFISILFSLFLSLEINDNLVQLSTVSEEDLITSTHW
jgi:hypothetical protein